MRLIVLLFSLILGLDAKEYYAKAEPYEILTVSSSVSGQVLQTDTAMQGKTLGKKPYIVMDDKLDAAELQSVGNKITTLEKTVEYNAQMARNLEQIIGMKQGNFDRIKDLAIKSAVEKDREYFDLISSRNTLLGIQKEIESLRIQIGDLKLRRTQLQKTIQDKHLTAPGMVLYQLTVKPFAFVSPGTPLAQLADVRKAKLTLYLSAEDAQDAQAKTVFIDGKTTPYRIERLWKIADASKLSNYKAEIIIAPPGQFSKLMRVELK